MFIWLNGCFGSGKSALAEQLRIELTDAIVYDPELIGALVGEYVPAAAGGDFQDLPLWRDLVVRTALAIRQHHEQPVVVPMTIIVPEYADEIIGGIRAGGETVHHFWLDVGPDELRRRVREQVIHPNDPQRDDAVRRWRLGQVNRCQARASALPVDVRVLPAGDRPPTELALAVLAAIGCADHGRGS